MERNLAPEKFSISAEQYLPGMEIGFKSDNGDSNQLRQFDGKELYDAAFEALLNYHLSLNSGEKSRQWAQEWQRKYDEQDLKTESGADKAVAEMLASLGQRFDYYYDRKAIDEHGKMTGAGLVGIGVRLGLTAKSKDNLITDKSRVVVDDVTDGSPAAQAGLRAGDLIAAVDGHSLSNLRLKDAVSKIRGDAGAPVTLQIERCLKDGSTETMEISAVRTKVNLQTVWYRELESGMSYVKLHDFDSGSAKKDMENALRKASSSRGLILDLRGNPGGNIENAHDITSMLLKDGPFLVTRARVDGVVSEEEIDFNNYFEYSLKPKLLGQSQPELDVKRRGELLIPHDLPLVVLVNEQTASSAEILAGALQYNRRAKIVGEATAGKGVAQTIVPLPFGRNLHVTSMEFSPGRESNDWSGIIPDLEVMKSENSALDQQLDSAQKVISKQVLELERKRMRRQEQRRIHEEEFYRSAGLNQEMH